MDYKMFFKKAFSDIRKEHSCPDDETVVNNILERAKTMNNNNENERTYNTQAYEVQPTPTKGHKALSVVAGIAGTAAVLTGAVFGLNWLNEHGGLKEGGIESSNGAGYHNDTTVTEPVKENKDILDAVGDVIEFEDMTATIEQVLYDGHVLRVIYRVDSYDENLYGSPADMTMQLFETADLLVEKGLLGSDGVFYRTGNGNTYDKYLDETNHRNVTTLFRELSEGESTHIEFIRMDGSKRQYSGAYTLNGIGMPENSYVMTDSFTVPSEAHHENDGYCEKTLIDSVELTNLGVYLMTSNKELYFNEFSFGLMFRDGSVKELIDIRHSTAQSDGDDSVYYGFADCYLGGYTVPKEVLGLNREIEDGMALIEITSYLYDPIDVNDVAAVIINGEEIPLNIYSGMDIETAKELLTKKNIDFDDVEEENTDIPVGCVIRSEPEIGLLDEKPENVTLYTPLTEKETSISVQFQDIKAPGEYKLLYYIDDEIQSDLTETIELSETKELVWNIKGSGVHRYKLLVKCLANQAFGELYECTIDFTKPEPEKDFDAFNAKTFKELAEHENGDVSLIEGIYAPGEEPYETEQTAATEEAGNDAQLPEFPIAISNGNGLYGEYLDTPLTGDEAWELVKERGGIDYDYPFPYDKSIFKFTGTEFCIDYADFDVTALVGGTVEFAGFYQGWGNTVLILDDNGHYWLYGHLAKDLNVAQGDTVEAGVKLGHTGSTGVTDHQRYALRVG